MNPFKRWAAFLEKHRTPPEGSRIYRFAVVILVTYSVLLTLHQMEWPEYWPWAVLLTPAASLLSYHRRNSSNIGLKIFLSLAMVALLLWFFGRLMASLTDPRLPLADLLIWLQVLHCFDLPGKKDLRYSVLVSLILMAIAGVLTFASSFGLFLLGYCLLLLLVGALDYWSDNRVPGFHLDKPSDTGRVGLSEPALDGRWLGRTVLVRMTVVLLGACLIFVFMPRYRGLALRTLPVSWDLQFRLAQISDGQIANQDLQAQKQDLGGTPQRFDGDSYFGFDSQVNLNARGRLSDRIMMKVRTSDWQYHRAVTFTEYTGFGWRSNFENPRKQTILDPPFRYESYGGIQSRLTIYYCETDLPNIVITPPSPRTLYYPSTDLYVIDSFPANEGLRTLVNSPAVLVSPSYLEEGLVYSVLNQVPDIPVSRFKTLRPIRAEAPEWEFLEPYLQLPEDLPARVRELSESLIGERTYPWEQATVLCTYLQQNYNYNLDVDFYPENVDAVDHFLFEAKDGYCEQFASALCIMARTVGIPARYVTGYLPGTYNPLTGFYEVRSRDAHAWAELYIPSFGWMIFDPVPGENATPELSDPPTEKWLLETLLEYLNLPEGVKTHIPQLFRATAVAAAIMFVASTLWGLGRRTRRHRRLGSELAPYLEKAEARTSARRQGETVRRWAQRMDRSELLELAQIYEETLYQDRKLTSGHRERLNSLLKKL